MRGKLPLWILICHYQGHAARLRLPTSRSGLSAIGDQPFARRSSGVLPAASAALNHSGRLPKPYRSQFSCKAATVYLIAVGFSPAATGERLVTNQGRSFLPNFSGALYPRRGARNFSPRSAAATFHPVFPLFQPAGARGKSPKGLPYPRAVSLERNHPAFADQHMARLARSPGIADTASPADSYGFAPGDRYSAPYRYRFASSPGRWPASYRQECAEQHRSARGWYYIQRYV